MLLSHWMFWLTQEVLRHEFISHAELSQVRYKNVSSEIRHFNEFGATILCRYRSWSSFIILMESELPDIRYKFSPNSSPPLHISFNCAIFQYSSSLVMTNEVVRNWGIVSMRSQERGSSPCIASKRWNLCNLHEATWDVSRVIFDMFHVQVQDVSKVYH